MGLWEWVYSATDTIKQKTPEVTPVTDICRKSYVHCRDSTTSVAREAYVYLSDDKVRDYVGRFAKYGALYIARSYGYQGFVSCVGGGPIFDIVSQSVQEKKSDLHKNSDLHKGRIDELETKVAKLENELSSMKLLEQSDLPRVIAMSKSEEELNQRPVDMVNHFMMQQFVGTKLFDNFMVPVSGGCKKKKKSPE